jgi:hypothetical protein
MIDYILFLTLVRDLAQSLAGSTNSQKTRHDIAMKAGRTQLHEQVRTCRVDLKTIPGNYIIGIRLRREY